YAGTYTLVMVNTVGAVRGDSILAAVVLRYVFVSDEKRYTLFGGARARKPWPNYLSYAPRADSSDKRVQPIEASYESQRGRLNFTIGNPGLRWTDSGIILDVFSLSSSGFVGRWVDGGRFVFAPDSTGGGVHPQGYFCMRREGAHAD